MDIVSHGLWGGISAGRASKKAYWSAFGIGVMPDLLSFGIYTAADIVGIVSGPEWGHGLPDPNSIPQFVYMLYNITHSAVIFSLVFAFVWFWRKKIFVPLLAWGVHILMDIPSHSSAFFPTPFLWPVSDYKVDGIGWGQPIVFFPNIILLAILYLTWFAVKLKKRKSSQT